MSKSKSEIIHLLRKKIIVITLMIITVITCLTVLMYQISRNDFERSLLINTLGKQRMLTQMIAKNSSHSYLLMQTLQTKSKTEIGENTSEELVNIKKSLVNETREFERVFHSIHTGVLVINDKKIDFRSSAQDSAAHLKGADEIWIEFKKSIDILINSPSITEEVVLAAHYINDNNEKLLGFCDEITQVVLDNTQNKIVKILLFSVLMFVLAVTALVVSLYNLYKYIIIPLNELYKGISEIGVANLNYDLRMPTSKELEPVINELNSSFSKLSRIFTLIENINNNISFREVLEYIYTTFSAFIPYSYIGIALIKDGGKTLEASYGISDGTIIGLPNNLQGKKTDIKATSLYHVLENGEARIINDYEEYIKGRIVKEYTSTILEAGLKSSITLPLKVNNHPIGIIFFSSKEKNIYTQEHVEFLKTLANSIAISLEQNIFVDHLLYSSILALAKLAEARDEDTGDHIERMKKYSRLIAQLLYDNSKYRDLITPEFIDDMERFSPMHDIGKVGIPDSILLKPDKLTKEEFEEMKFHTLYGARVLKSAEDNMKESGRSIFKLGIEIAAAHHEKWDGTGYPKGFKGKQIPLCARIVAVADVFDALTSARPYKKPFPFDKSFEIIAEGSGKHFDPEIVKVFVENKDSIYSLYNEFKC